MRETRNFNGLGIENLLVTIANKTITLHPIKREWKISIIILIMFRLLAAVVSIFAAYFFFYQFVSLVIPTDYLIPIITFLFLIVIEFLSNQFTAKFFKFLYRKRWKTAISVFPVMVVFYVVSFISSSNGLATYANNKVIKSNSATTIRKVFDVVRTIGLNHFDVNGNYIIKKMKGDENK